MSRIFCIMGKSASGKDSIFSKIIEDKNMSQMLKRIIPYTTRPIRDGERDGIDYRFCTEEDVQEYEAASKIIELREYDTVHGIWKYFTVEDEHLNLEKYDYITVGTLESYTKLSEYFGKEKVCPIYIEVDDGERLTRALNREKQQKEPKYEEMCRRFIADASDFSEEKLKAAGVEKRFQNIDFDDTIEQIKKYISDTKVV